MISCAAILTVLVHVLQLCVNAFVLEVLCLKLCATLNVHQVFESFLPEWTYTLSLCSLCLEPRLSAPGAGCSSAGCHLITAPIKQLPRSFTVLCVFSTTPVVISQIIGVTVGASGAGKKNVSNGSSVPHWAFSPTAPLLKTPPLPGSTRSGLHLLMDEHVYLARVSMLGGNPFKVLMYHAHVVKNWRAFCSR